MGKIRWLCTTTLFPLLALGVVAFVLEGIHAVRMSAEIDYGEGIVMWQAAHVTDWSAAYHPVNVSPHVIFHYPPVYHLVSRAMAFLTGDLLAAGRLVSLLSLVGVCVILSLLTWHSLPPHWDRLSRWIATALSGMLVFTVPVWTWAAVMRVDTLAVLFSFSGIALFIIARNRPWGAYCAFLFFVLALYTKQTMLAAPTACFVLLLIENPRRALRVGALASGIGLVALVLLQTATHGLFLRNIVTYNRNPFLLTQLIRMWLDEMSAAGVVLGCALILPAAFLFHAHGRFSSFPAKIRRLLRRDRFGRCLVVASAVLLFALAFSVTCGKQGAAYNYFLDLDLTAILAGGLFVGWLLQERRGRSARADTMFPLFVIILLVFQCSRTVHPLYDEVHALGKPLPDYFRQVQDIVAMSPRLVYSEDMVLLMLAKKEIPAEPAIITSLAQSGQWNESGFVQRIVNGEFSTIVVSTDLTNPDRFSPRIARAIEQSYEERRHIGPYRIYEPR
jgi:hypothetical protein